MHPAKYSGRARRMIGSLGRLRSLGVACLLLILIVLISWLTTYIFFWVVQLKQSATHVYRLILGEVEQSPRIESPNLKPNKQRIRTMRETSRNHKCANIYTHTYIYYCDPLRQPLFIGNWEKLIIIKSSMPSTITWPVSLFEIHYESLLKKHLKRPPSPSHPLTPLHVSSFLPLSHLKCYLLSFIVLRLFFFAFVSPSPSMTPCLSLINTSITRPLMTSTGHGWRRDREGMTRGRWRKLKWKATEGKSMRWWEDEGRREGEDEGVRERRKGE